VAVVRIRFTRKQSRSLLRRASLEGTSVSQVVAEAVAFYLGTPQKIQDELRVLAPAANRATDRMIKRLDETIAFVDRALNPSSSATTPPKKDRNPRARV
jgi:hypothetical protein